MCNCCMSRRELLGAAAMVGAAATAGLGMADSVAAAAPPAPFDPQRPLEVGGKALRVLPVFMHVTFTPQDKRSWKSWSDVNNPKTAAEEAGRINKELAALRSRCDFPIELLPLATVNTPEQAAKLHETDYDAILLFPATGGANLLRACLATRPDRDVVVFVRHESGLTYYWYEAVGTRVLKKGLPEEMASNSAANHGGPTVHDVVVDDYDEVLWRLRALAGVKNFAGRRIVALGGPGGKYDGSAPTFVREKFALDIVSVSYDDLGKRLAALKKDAAFAAQCEAWTKQYLDLPGTKLETQREFVVRSFPLWRVFRDWMREHDATAFTIGACMGTVMPVSETTACLVLSWLNDEGAAAFCESDFVIVPAGLLLHAVARRPVFMCNSTFPHKGVVTVAHCTCPRRMDGRTYEPARVLTHYESEYGAAPKVDMPVGQEVTILDPEYATGRWVAFKAKVKANPFHAICRSQQDLTIEGDWKKLLAEARDSHWMLAYGDWMREAEYVARKLGLTWATI